MTGTLLNAAAVFVGGLLGLAFGTRLKEKIRTTVIAGLGLFTLAIGVKMFFDSRNVIIVLISLLVGGVIGEGWNIEEKIEKFGIWLREKFAGKSEKDSARFANAFLTASLVFCVGPLTILGSIQDGLSGDYSLLAIKSVLDGFASLVFASTLGVGVLFSIIVIIGYQGGLSLLAAQAEALLSEGMIAEMTAVGGILLMGIGISSLLEIKNIRVGNFLPALVIAPLLVALANSLGW